MNYLVVYENSTTILNRFDNLREAIDYATKEWEKSDRTDKLSIYIKVTDI